MKMVLATIARGFELVEVGADGGGDPRERITFTMLPEDIRMRVAPRQ